MIDSNLDTLSSDYDPEFIISKESDGNFVWSAMYFPTDEYIFFTNGGNEVKIPIKDIEILSEGIANLRTFLNLKK